MEFFFFFFFFFWKLRKKKELDEKKRRKKKQTKKRTKCLFFSAPHTLSMLHRTNARAIMPTTCQRWLNFFGFGSSSGPPDEDDEESSSLDCVDMIGTAAVGGTNWERRHCLSRWLRLPNADRLRAPAMEATGSEGAWTEKRVLRLR